MNTTLSKSTPTSAQNAAAIQYRRPVYEVSTVEGGFEIRVQVPGCNREGIRVHHEKDNLTIQASRREAANKDWKLLHREIHEADYQLQLNLNVAINGDAITARTEDGVLTIHLPLAEEAKPRLINVD